MRPAWKKVLLIVVDILIAVYTVVAVTAFNKPDTDKQVCTKVNIAIDDKTSNAFIDASEIKHRLETTGLDPVGKPMSSINPRKVEEMLKRSAFVNNAECYKTHDGHVFISITQRLPVIRIKADNGDDYYVDDKNSIMPKSNYTSDLIIASGNINRTFATNYISPLGKALMAKPLWKNLIEQVHVTPSRGIEIVPRVGDHIVYLGNLPTEHNSSKREKAISDFIDTKLTRLMKFYKFGLSEAGWNKYDYINMEFDNQIICKRRENTRHPAASEPTQMLKVQPDTLKRTTSPNPVAKQEKTEKPKENASAVKTSATKAKEKKNDTPPTAKKKKQNT